MLDRFRRNIEYLRISVTDRCNLRCRYCMPGHGVKKLRHGELLTYEELLRVVHVLARLGIRKVRLTGGEPLVRGGIVDFVRALKALPGIEHVAITTNGVLLPEMVEGLKAAGLDSVNVSLDALDGEVFAFLARRPLLPMVLQGLEALRMAGFQDVKLNCVPLAGVNDKDILRIAGLAKERPIKVRFIELMPIGCAFEAGLHGVPMTEVQLRLREAYGALLPLGQAGGLHGPAEYFRIPGFRGQVGFIDAMEHKFCASCNRIRLTAEGFLKLCLHAGTGLAVKPLLRGSDEQLEKAFSRAIFRKPAEHLFLAENGDMRYMYQVGG